MAAGAHTGSRRDGFGAAAAAAGSCALKGARGREDLRGNRSRRVGHARGLAGADLARRVSPEQWIQGEGGGNQ